MRQSLLSLLCIFFILPVFSQVQTVEDDFEGNGTITSWFGDDCQMDNAFSNPYVQGINTSATVLRYNDIGGQYANVHLNVDQNFSLSYGQTFSLKIYVPSNGITGNEPNQISLKLQNANLPEPWSTQCEIIKPIAMDQWQTITFDFVNDPYLNIDPNLPHPVTRADFNRVVLQVNGENNNAHVLAYLDDFFYEETITTGSSVFNQLVWSDEFEENGAVDPSKWFHQTQLPDGSGWFNGEVQHYTNRLNNSYVDNGFLHIVAKKETYTDQGQTKEYTSARLNSKFAFTYGRVEVRAKLPFGLGTWPAIWMLGKNVAEPGGFWYNNFGTVGWPACGEVDIMEHWGYNQNYVQSALHTPSSFGGTVNVGGILANDVSNNFHVYALEWSATEMQFSIDGIVYYTYAPSPQNPDTWPFVADQYLLLNVAMTGFINPTFTESQMVVDYVRVYQQGTPSQSNTVELQKIELYPNPVEDKLTIQVPARLLGAKAKIFSASGQELSSFIQEQRSMSFDWSSFPKGVYFLVFEVDSDSLSYKVIKN